MLPAIRSVFGTPAAFIRNIETKKTLDEEDEQSATLVAFKHSQWFGKRNRIFTYPAAGRI
jgi:hypothetical protein